jgi:hypothetical protein
MISPVNHQQLLSGNKQSLYAMKNCLLVGERPRNPGRSAEEDRSRRSG